MKGKMFFLVFAGVLLAACSSMFYTVHEREHAILMYFGKPEPRTIQPGLHFKWPVVNTVQKYDRRLRIYVPTAITQTLQDKKTIILQAYLCWKITDPLKFYESVRYVAGAEQKLNDIASSALGSRISKHPITAIISTDKSKVKLGEIEQEMKEYMSLALKDTYGITVERFGINRLALPNANEKTVYDRMKSERAVAASEYRTEGRREADFIRARAKRAADEIVSKALAQETAIRGEGEAKATQIYRDAYSKDPEFYRFWRTLETYKKIFGSETTLVIPADSELMKYFQMSGAGAAEKKKP